MRKIVVVALLWSLLPAARADQRVDVAEVKSKLKVLTDGKNHFVAVLPFGEGADEHLYYGDGKTFFAQRVFGGGSTGTAQFDRVFWEPRVARPAEASIDFKDGKYTITCERRTTEMRPLDDAPAKTMLDAATFERPRWKRQAYALARDATGRYFYVDRMREPEENKSFRLFAGPRGNLKPLKMTNVVSDSEGDIFATKSGSLRLILGKKEASWVSGKKTQKLISLPIEDNHILIYSDLGVYAGQPLGTPCDDL